MTVLAEPHSQPSTVALSDADSTVGGTITRGDVLARSWLGDKAIKAARRDIMTYGAARVVSAIFLIAGGLVVWLGIGMVSSDAGAVCGGKGMSEGDKCLNLRTGEETTTAQRQESNTSAKHVIGYVILGVGGIGVLIGGIGLVDAVRGGRRTRRSG